MIQSLKNILCSFVCILTLTVVFIPPLSAVNPTFSISHTDPTLGFPDCVKYMGYSPLGSNRYALRFFNSCGDKVYVFVCIEFSDGTNKIYKSARRVPVAGNYEIFTLPGDEDPKFVHMSYGRAPPLTPAPCKTI
jgi:hypothetical protein